MSESRERFADAEKEKGRTARIRAAQDGGGLVDLAVQLHQQALDQGQKGNLRRALILSRHAWRFMAMGDGAESPDVANIGNSLSGFFQDLGRYDDAERVARRSVEIMEQYAGDPDRSIQTVRTQSLDTLGAVLRLQARYEEAERFHRRALTSPKRRSASTICR